MAHNLFKAIYGDCCERPWLKAGVGVSAKEETGLAGGVF